MKKEFDLNGQTYKFKKWRVPEGFELPAQFKDGPYELDPEMLFEDEKGNIIGLHPRNTNLLKEK